MEEDPGLRRIIEAEICSSFGKRVETCSPEQFVKTPELAVGAQVVTPDYALPLLNPLVPRNRSIIPLTFSVADEHVSLVRNLAEPSIVGVASVSETVLKTARSVLPSALGQRHTLREFPLPSQGHTDLRGIDVVFCDSLAMLMVRCRRKIHYRLIARGCLSDLVAMFETSAPESPHLIGQKSAGRKPRRIQTRA